MHVKSYFSHKLGLTCMSKAFKISVMIRNLIVEALNANGASMLDGFGLSSDKHDKAFRLAKDSVLGGLTQSFQSGNIGAITGAFSGGSSNSLVQSIVSTYGSKLISKLGLNESLAKTISTAIIPMIFNYIGKKEDVPTESDEGVKDLLGDLAGSSIKDKLGGMLKSKFKI